MASFKLFITTIVFSLLLVHVVEAQQLIESHGPKRALLGINCGAACTARCQLSSRPNLCHRACGTCCARCGCVPPGTSGNQKLCACYYNQATHGGRRKCP